MSTFQEPQLVVQYELVGGNSSTPKHITPSWPPKSNAMSGPPVPNPVPIDGGIMLLVGVGLVLAFYGKVLQHRWKSISLLFMTKNKE